PLGPAWCPVVLSRFVLRIGPYADDMSVSSSSASGTGEAIVAAFRSRSCLEERKTDATRTGAKTADIARTATRQWSWRADPRATAPTPADGGASVSGRRF